MFEFILFLAIFVGIMAISALIFGSWFIIMLVRGIAGFFGVRQNPPPIGPRRPSGAVQIGPVPNQRICPYELCKSPNDPTARFCRRCGREMAPATPVKVRRAAVW
jgi:hypothetical protein